MTKVYSDSVKYRDYYFKIRLLTVLTGLLVSIADIVVMSLKYWPGEVFHLRGDVVPSNPVLFHSVTQTTYLIGYIGVDSYFCFVIRRYRNDLIK